jgi:hypothetical protein
VQDKSVQIRQRGHSVPAASSKNSQISPSFGSQFSRIKRDEKTRRQKPIAIYPGKRTTGKKSREFLPRAAKERKNILTNFDVFPREKRTQKETIPSKNLKLNKTSSTPESHIFFDFHP